MQRFRDSEVAEWVSYYNIPLVDRAWASSAVPGVPERWTVDVEVEKGRTIRIDQYYITTDAQMAHLNDWLDTVRSFAIDVETGGLKSMDGLDPLSETSGIATLQVGNPFAPTPAAYTICLRSVSAEALAKLKAKCQDRTIRKQTQNGRFEAKWLQQKLGWRVRNIADTQVTEMVIRTGLLNKKSDTAKARGKGESRASYKFTSMANMSARYLRIDIDKDKDLRTGFWDTPPKGLNLRQIIYANGDVVYPYVIAEKQAPIIEDRKLRNIVKIEWEFIPVLADLELTGIRIDTKAWQALWREAIVGRADAERLLDKLMLDLNPDLFGGTDLNVRPLYYDKKGKPKPLNYDSPDQVKWAIVQYCTSINWSRKILTTWQQVWAAKKIHGMDWLAKAQKRWDDNVAKGESPDRERPLLKDIPDWVLAESDYVILTQADKDTLTLAHARKQLPGELVSALLEYGKHSIRCDSFGNEFLIKNVRADGRIHTEVHQCITNTGRVSMSPNLQNIPNDPRYRMCFIPGHGFVFCIADHSQVEPRITAEMSGDEIYTSTFLMDDDLYLAVAEAMLGYRPDKKTEEGSRERSIFKTVVLALAYSMGARKLRDRLTLALYKDILSGKVEVPTFEYAKHLYDRFFEVHSKVKDFQETCAKMAQPFDPKTGVPNPRRIWDDFVGDYVTYVEAICGRKRFFPPDSKGAVTEGPNVGPQSGSATFTKVAACFIQRYIDDHGYNELAHIVNLVHDEVVVEAHHSIKDEMAAAVKDCMTRAGQFFCKTVPIKSEWPENSQGYVLYWAKKIEAIVEEAA